MKHGGVLAALAGVALGAAGAVHQHMGPAILAPSPTWHGTGYKPRRQRRRRALRRLAAQLRAAVGGSRVRARSWAEALLRSLPHVGVAHV